VSVSDPSCPFTFQQPGPGNLSVEVTNCVPPPTALLGEAVNVSELSRLLPEIVGSPREGGCTYHGNFIE
jgi:hypothetical protein